MFLSPHGLTILGTFIIFWWMIVNPFSFAKEIIYCTKQDCYEVEQEIVDAAIDMCIYKSQMIMLIADWKKTNRFKQIKWVPGGKKINCMKRIPNMFLNGNETEEQKNFLEKLKCSFQNLKTDPIFEGQKFYFSCLKQFNRKFPGI